VQNVDAKHSSGIFQLEVILDYLMRLQSSAVCCGIAFSDEKLGTCWCYNWN